MFNFVMRILCTALVLTLTACGGGGGGGTTTPPANKVPVISEGASTSVNISVNSTPTAFGLTLHASDADNDTLSWSISTAAGHGTASVPAAPANTGPSMAVSYAPAPDFVGADSFDVQVSDGKGGTATFTVNVSVGNDNPVIQQSSPVGVSMSENSSPTAFSLTLNASDLNGDTLTWSLGTTVTAQHGTPSVSGTGASPTVNYVPNINYVGGDSFDVQVDDGHGGIATVTVNVTVNASNGFPVISEGATTAVSMSENSSPTPFSLNLHASDPDSDTMTWSISTAAGHGTASVSNPATGTSMVVNYTPNINYIGNDSFVVQVSDGKGGITHITVNVTVTASNGFPVISEGASTSVNMSVNSTPTAFSLTLHATDPDSDTMTWSILTQSANGGTASVPAAPNNTGASMPISYTNPGYAGTDSFVVQVSDGKGGTATITVNVTLNNDNPGFQQTSPASVSMSENSNPNAFSLTLDASDPNNDTLTWSILTQGTYGTASVPAAPANTGASMAIGYSPNTDYIGTDSFVVQVADGHSGTATITVDVTVTTTNTVNINVDGYVTYNRPFVSVTICEPGTSTCQTIDHVVIDTGAVGLRILASEVTGVSLPAYSGAASHPIAECYPLIGGFIWGSLKTADVKMGGELAGNVPIQIINNTDAGVVPSGCSSVGTDIGSLGTAGIKAKGILGLQYFPADCGPSCETASNNLYYTCTTPSNAATCSTIGVLSADQVPNPVSRFGLNGSGVADNNGVIISMPAIDPAGALNPTGTLTFGVGTQPNNQLNSSATVMTAHSPTGFLPTDFDGKTLCNSMIDSGSNNLNFPQGTTGVPLCAAPNGNFYCPASTTSLPATIKGLNGASTTFNFDVANTDNLSGSFTAFNDVAANLGTLFVGTYTGCTGTTVTDGSFIWGLPFFFGRQVVFVNEGSTVSSTSGPFVAF